MFAAKLSPISQWHDCYHFEAYPILTGNYKSWTLDSGLDSGLDYGLKFGLKIDLIMWQKCTRRRQEDQKNANTRSNTELHVEVFPASWSTKKIKYQTVYRPCVAGSVGLQHLQECEELMEGKVAQQHGYTARKYGSGQLMVVWRVLRVPLALQDTLLSTRAATMST